MVQIIPAAKQKYSFGSAVGQNFGEGMGKGMLDEEERRRHDKYRKEEDEALRKRGIELSGTRDPEVRAALIANDLKMGMANKRANVSYSKQNAPNALRKPTEEPSPSDQTINPKKQSIYSNENEDSDRKILTFDEEWDESARIAQYRTENGIPTSTEEVLPLVHARNEGNKSFAATQEHYGDQAVQALYRNVGTDVSNPDLEAKFRKYGEEAAKKSVSQSQFHKNLAEKVKNFKNALTNIERLPGPRLFSEVGKKFLGKSKTEEEKNRSVKTAIKELLDEGESDIVRTALSKKGYGPEEIESFITELPEMSKKHLANMPKIETPTKKQNIYEKRYSPMLQQKPPEYNQAQKQAVANTVNNVFKDDPSVNLVLLRKAMGDKNVDWRLFKESIDNGILNGSFKLNPFQLTQMTYIDEPPLDDLDKMLHGLNFIGE